MVKFSGQLSRRYGTALFAHLVEVHKNDPNSIEHLELHLRCLKTLSLFFDKNFIQTFCSPSGSQQQKLGLIEELCNVIYKKENQSLSNQIIPFFKIILDNKRFYVIGSIIKFFSKKIEEHLNIKEVEVMSAHTLTNTDLQDFEKELQKFFKYNLKQQGPNTPITHNKKIIFQTKLDASLKSGYILKIENLIIDSSLKSRLKNIRNSLI